MARKFRKVPQPPIDRHGRPSEEIPRRVALAVIVIGAALAVAGYGRMVARPDRPDVRVPEWRLVQAAVQGGFYDEAPDADGVVIATGDPNAAPGLDPNGTIRPVSGSPAIDQAAQEEKVCPT